MTPPPSILKAAVLLSSLDRASADSILVRLPEEHAAAVVRAIDQIAELPAAKRNEVIAEFLAQHEAPTILPFEEPEPASNGNSCPLAFSVELSDAVFGTLLGEEHPQAAAIVLAHLPPQRASSLLNCFPASVRSEVLKRVADLSEEQCDLLPEIAAALQQQTARPQPEPTPLSPGMQAARAIIAAAGDHADSLVGDLHYAEPTLAQQLQAERSQSSQPTDLALSFNGLEQLSDSALAMIFGRCDSESVLLALAGARTSFTNRMLAKLSTHEATAFQHRMHQLAPLRLSDVEEAQRTVVEAAESLMRAGKISPPSRRFAAAA